MPTPPLKQFHVIHGPNLNMLGQREPDVYGTLTLTQINQQIQTLAQANGVHVDCFQSNHEGDLVDHIQRLIGQTQGVIINPGAYTHTSVAIRDALTMLNAPIIEVHLSNIYKREAFRAQSFISPIATAVISGLGAQGYSLALQALINKDS